MKFRNDISFLRAVSVMAVLLYHFKFTFFKGGFIGVDIFFVISGYLMTRIILTGFSENNFSVLDFYKKRMARIFPALLVMITFFAVLIYFLIPTQFINYTKLYLSSSLFFSNIYYYFISGYFNASSQTNFLLHTWSLSVEWQFYLLYPLVLMIFKKAYIGNRGLFTMIFLTFIFLSIGSMVFHYLFGHSYSFYMTDTRAWEMMFGGLAFLFKDSLNNKSIKIKKSLFYLSVAAIVSFIVFTDEHYVRWPFFITIIPVGCTALILLLNLDFKLFENKIIKYTGDISYSLYLWHWPFFVLSLFLGFNEDLEHRFIFIVLSIIFAVLSYHLVEKRNYQHKYRFIIGFTIILSLLSFIITKIKPEYFLDKRTAKLAFTTTYYKNSEEATQQFSLGNRHLLDVQPFKNYNLENLKISQDKKNIILLGDSHAGMFSQTIGNIFPKNRYNLIQVTGDATFPIIDSDTGYRGPKDLFNFFFRKYFPENYKNVNLVIISSNYSDYDKDDLVKKINFTESYFKNYSVPVVYLGQTDNYFIDFPTYFNLKNRYNTENINNIQLNDKAHATNKFLINKLGNRYIDMLDHEITKVNKDGMPYIYDQNHLTYYGTEQYRNFIVESLPLK
jgi:peptidoglycan/LPS O-acetylase OafA/YrhL